MRPMNQPRKPFREGENVRATITPLLSRERTTDEVARMAGLSARTAAAHLRYLESTGIVCSEWVGGATLWRAA